MATILLDTSVIFDHLNGRYGRTEFLGQLIEQGHVLALAGGTSHGYRPRFTAPLPAVGFREQLGMLLDRHSFQLPVAWPASGEIGGQRDVPTPQTRSFDPPSYFA